MNSAQICLLCGSCTCLGSQRGGGSFGVRRRVGMLDRSLKVSSRGSSLPATLAHVVCSPAPGRGWQISIWLKMTENGAPDWRLFFFPLIPVYVMEIASSCLMPHLPYHFPPLSLSLYYLLVFRPFQFIPQIFILYHLGGLGWVLCWELGGQRCQAYLYKAKHQR